MSETLTPPEAAEDTPTVEKIDLTSAEAVAAAIENAGDARVNDTASLFASLSDFRDKMGKAVSQAVRSINARKNAAQANAAIRVHFLLPDGPDWAGKTTAYKAVVQAAMDEAFGDKLTKDERNREISAIRQHVTRGAGGSGGFLEIAIRQYVRETMEDMPAEGDADTPAFLHAVRSEYKRCEITPPRRYLSPEELQNGGGGGGGGGTKSPAEAAIAAVQGLSSLSPKYAALLVLHAASSLASLVEAGNKEGGVQDRDDVKALVLRIQTVTAYTRKAVDGKASPDDAEAVKEALFSEEDSRV